MFRGRVCFQMPGKTVACMLVSWMFWIISWRIEVYMALQRHTHPVFKIGHCTAKMAFACRPHSGFILLSQKCKACPFRLETCSFASLWITVIALESLLFLQHVGVKFVRELFFTTSWLWLLIISLTRWQLNKGRLHQASFFFPDVKPSLLSDVKAHVLWLKKPIKSL